MHTPAKGAGPNKGLGGSNPPFSANDYKNCSFVISDKHLKLQWIKGLKRMSFKPFFLVCGNFATRFRNCDRFSVTIDLVSP